jgi:hypothetical protein
MMGKLPGLRILGISDDGECFFGKSFFGDFLLD